MIRSHWLLVLVPTLGGIGVGRFLPVPTKSLQEVLAAGRANPFALASKQIDAASPPSVKIASAPGGRETSAGLESEFRRLWRVMEKGNKGDFEKVLQAAERLTDADAYRALTVAMSFDGPKAQQLVARLAARMKSTSQLALRALLENPKWRADYGTVSAIFENLAKVDPKLAWEEATKPGRSFGSIAAHSVGHAWAEKSSRDGIAYADAIVDNSLRKQLTDAIFGEWMRSKPADFIAWLRAQPDAAAWDDIVPWQNATASTLEEFLALASILPDRISQPIHEGESPYDGLFKKAGRKDEYLDWIQALPEGPVRDAASASLAKAMLGWNPDDALAMLPAVRDANAQTQITSAVAAYRAAASAQGGVEFAESLQDPAARALALRSVASTLAEIDPAGAAAVVAAHLDELAGEMDAVVTKWSEFDPQSAAAFALEHKAAGVEAGIAEKNNYGLRSVMAAWVRDDAHAASEWVLKMEPGLLKDIATDALAGVAARVEPVAALGWAMTVSDPELRAKTIRDCINNWSSSDSKAAEAWVQSAPLDEAARKKLSAIVQQNAKSRSSSSGSNSYEDKVIFY